MMGANVLIVDDEQQIRKLLTRYLEAAGYCCHEAENVGAAKEVLANHDFDLLLSDLKMPEESGLDLIRYCKQHYPHIGRVMLTAYGSPEIAREIMDVGVYGYIIKPLSKNVVLITVENALRHLLLDRHMQAYKEELEKKISRRTEKLTAIMNNIHAGVMMVDSDMKILEINRVMEKWFFDEDPLNDAFCYQLLIGKNRQEVCADCPMVETLQTGRNREVQRILKTSEGEKEFRIVTSPIKDNSNTIYGGIALYEDVTERAMLEREYRQAQKLEAVGQLAAGIAHEINTPIQYIGSNISFLKEAFEGLARVVETYDASWQELIKSKVVSEELNRKVAVEKENADLDFLWEEIPETVEQSLEGVSRVNKIVRAMKDFAHPGEEEKKAADINKILDSTVTVCRNEWKYVADIEKELAGDLKAVPCFSGEISQVFLNIIVNGAHAIDAFTAGGRNGKGTISIKTRQMNDRVQIRIGDTGGGIPENVQERIFDPFFTTKERGKGTGQGLAIAYRVVVEKHGGKLFFETEQGLGTTFFIELPCEPKEQQVMS